MIEKKDVKTGSAQKKSDNSKNATSEQNEISMEDLEKVSGGAYTPGKTPSPIPPPKHHAE